MSEFTLRQLQYFVGVVDEGSVTAAAKASHISQAAVSMAVVQLEKSVGVQLLHRTRSNRVVPTPAGTDLAVLARRILSLAAEVESTVVQGFSELRGPLRIGYSPTVSPRMLPPLLEHFTHNHPRVDVRTLEERPAALQHLVREGQLDVAVMYRQQGSEGFVEIEVADVVQHVMLPEGHRLADAESVHLGELADEPLILLDLLPTLPRILSAFRALGLDPHVSWTSGNMETIRSLVARGLGYSYVNSVPTTRVSFEGLPLRYVPVADAMEPNPIVAILPRDHEPARRIQEAIDFMLARRAEERGEAERKNAAEA